MNEHIVSFIKLKTIFFQNWRKRTKTNDLLISRTVNEYTFSQKLQKKSWKMNRNFENKLISFLLNDWKKTQTNVNKKWTNVLKRSRTYLSIPENRLNAHLYLKIDWTPISTWKYIERPSLPESRINASISTWK